MLNKLKSEQGVTILMALLFLLLAIVISCIVITAAITAVKTVDEDRAQQQAYLNVSSAAELLKREIVGTQIKTVTTEPVESQGNGQNGWNAQEPEVVNPKESMVEIWAKIAPNMKPQSATMPPAAMKEPVEFYIEAAVGSMTSQVKVEMIVSYVKVETAFTFQVVATLRNMDEAHPCEMILTMEAQTNTVANESGGQRTTTTTYTWTANNVVISRGKGESA